MTKETTPSVRGSIHCISPGWSGEWHFWAGCKFLRTFFLTLFPSRNSAEISSVGGNQSKNGLNQCNWSVIVATFLLILGLSG